MAAAIKAVRQVVTVQPGGRVEFTSPELPSGARAEVIVLIESPAAPGQGAVEVLDALQRSLALDPAAAAQWAAAARADRESWPCADPTQ
jgi:hypothetical protein